MSRRTDTVARVAAEQAVAVVRTDSPDAMVELARALLAGGVSCIEITLTVPGALDAIRRVAEELAQDADAPEVLIGAGSVLDAHQAEAAIEAGARYVVSPVFKRDIVEAAHSLDAAAMPGCFTPTEILTATEAGADVVKVFPADALGMAFFRGVLAPMPHLRLMPTGGVSLTNADGWVAAGAVAVGVGSALVDKRAVAAGDWATITANARTLRATLDA
ncbi:MAG: 2-dehydro-3-deoxyphosphogluconate aldolase [Rhodothermaceae bacterium]|nr:2-dehydro-3-deoxyphosphogluconate aldolase [Rhodothermaceae bacterium]MBC12179.1 2-dehydro-3-deoxyphosphogluconate aldolase [Rhodothermaceae bacterium]